MDLIDLPRGHFGAILADPPWRFRTWNKATAVQKVGSKSTYTSSCVHYGTMAIDDIRALPVGELAAEDCCLFLWITWPNLEDALSVMAAWGFAYKTCAFAWLKAHAGQLELFQDDVADQMGLGYWTRANSEVCLLATRGRPKRLNADVRQAIIEPRREHSRKPDCIHARIERLVAGPYLECFARQRQPGWTVWGLEVDKFAMQACIYPHCLSPNVGGNEQVCLRPCPKQYDGEDDFSRSIEECYRAVLERKMAGGKGWPS
jgi:N6-adenosine-specific RNA methylase IME4